MDNPCSNIGTFPDPPSSTVWFQVTVDEDGKLSVSPDSHGTEHPIGETKKFYITLQSDGPSAKFANPPATFSSPSRSAQLTACRVSDDQAVVVDVPLVKGKTTITMEIEVEVSDGQSSHILKIDPKIVNQPHQGGGA